MYTFTYFIAQRNMHFGSISHNIISTKQRFELHKLFSNLVENYDGYILP